MSPSDWASILALVGVVITALFSFRGGLPAGAKAVAEGFKALNDELQEQNRELKEELAELRLQLATTITERTQERVALEKKVRELTDKVRRQENHINALIGGIRILVDQLSDAGIDPKWKPPDWDTPRPRNRSGRNQ